MSILEHTATGKTWTGSKANCQFESDQIKFDFDITSEYTLDGISIKITKQTTNSKYITVLDYVEC
jgi:hypothetical protein